MEESTSVALLELPKGSILGLDGQILALQRDDFVAITRVPREGFHLVTARGGGAGGDVSKASHVTSAFVIPEDPLFCRKYDPHTEEISPELVDTNTEANLLSQLEGNCIPFQRSIPYHQFIPQEGREIWQGQTNFISAEILELRKIRTGGKLVAGSIDEQSAGSDEATDGNAIRYPPIPILGLGHTAKHKGTKTYLATLSPSERTALHLSSYPNDHLFSNLLGEYYKNDWRLVLGDLQLSFVSFQNLHCYSSMEHWRDLLAVLSYVSENCISRHVQLFAGVLEVVRNQLSRIESEFFDSSEVLGDNFLIPAIRRMSKHASGVSSLEKPLLTMVSLLQNRFHIPLADELSQIQDSDSDGAFGDSDEDGPVYVDASEVEQAEARSKASDINYTPSKVDQQLKNKYPVLAAANMPAEDFLMTCARALDDAQDVSLVREAAAFLEEVEALNSSMEE